MGWTVARDALAEILAGVDEVDEVLTTSPLNASALHGTCAVIPPAPPARRSSRTAGGRTETTYRVTLTLSRAFASTNDDTATTLDAAVEAINAEMENHITLAGRATSTAAPEWAAAVVAEYPPGSGIDFMLMTGTIEVLFVRTYDRSA